MKVKLHIIGRGKWARIAAYWEPLTTEGDRERAAMYAEAVVGGRWRPSARAWVYPLTTAKCREMRSAWGGMVRIHNDLAAWYREAAKAEKVQTQQAAQTDAQLHVVPEVAPALFDALAPDQRAGAAWVATAYEDAGLYAPEMGVGKTRAVIAGLVERQVTGNILIVCPKISVRSVWGKELGQWAPWPVYLARGTRAQRQAAIEAHFADPAPTKVLVIVAEMLRIKAKLKNGKIAVDDEGDSTFMGYEYPHLFSRVWDTVVIDESQKLLASLTVAKATLAGWGLKKLRQGDSPKALRLAVTATPWGDGGEVHGIFGTLHWCWPREFSSFWRFAEENFLVMDKRIGKGRTAKVIGNLKDPDGVDGLFAKLGPRVFRRTLEEVSPEHKGLLSYGEVFCEMTPKQVAQYVELSENGEVMLDGGILQTNGVLSELTRARQVANGVIRLDGGKVRYTGESGKLDMLMHWLERTGRRKVLVASQFNEYLDVVAERLRKEGVGHHMLTGRTTDNQRDRMMAEFQAKGGPRVFLLNGKAGGVSITLDAADYLFQLDEMYPPEANEQLHRRIFRRSRVHKAQIVYFRSEGTIDENIAGNVATKLHAQLASMDGRRGLAVVREHIRYRAGSDA